MSIKTSAEIRLERRRVPNPVADLTLACLWPKKGENLGTALRTCDAVNARMVVPEDKPARMAILRGNTIGLHNSPVELVDDWWAWLWRAASMSRVVGVELAHDSIPLTELEPMAGPTIVLVGHEVSGIPNEALSLCDQIVEIPMVGVGNSLNVAVSASLVLYKLRGWV